MRRLVSFCIRIVLSLAGFFAHEQARAQIINTPNIEELCRTAPTVTYRRTLVYVDISSVKKEKTDWGLTILNRLELAAREHLTLLSVNPSTFEVSPILDSCYPTLTKQEIEGTRSGRGLVDKFLQLDPADQQRENLQTFDARLRNGLNKVVGEASKFEQGKRRNILGAIAFDKNRFADRNAHFRVIIYTDGVLVDPGLEPSVPEQQQVKTLVERYPASLSGADVSIYGIASSNEKGANSLESQERMFSAFFLSSWAHLKSFSSALPQQSGGLFPQVIRMDGAFDGGGAQGSVKLVLATGQEGALAEGWLAFNIGRTILYVPYQGDYRCDNADCNLSASATESVPPLSAISYFRKGDKLLLKGKAGSMEGTLQAGSREVFKDGNQEVKYNLKFQKP